MSTEPPAAPEGASTEPEEGLPPGTRTLTDAELQRYGEELQKAVGRAGTVAVHEGALHLRVAGRKNLRACSKAAKRLTHWPAGVVVRVHRVEPKVPETPEQMRARLKRDGEAVELKARSQGFTTATPEEIAEHEARRGLAPEQVEQIIRVSEMKQGRPYTEAEKAGLRQMIRGGVLL